MPHCIVKEHAKLRERYSEFADDKLLMLIGTSRDRAALSELYHRFQLPITRFLQRQMFSTTLVEEAYNDVILTVWNKAAGFRGESKVSTWLFGIAYRTGLAHSRKERRHNHVSSDELVDSVISGEGTEAQADVNESLHAALLELSEAHRIVTELAYFHGYSTSEIAQIVDIPANTVKTRLFHARKKLKAALEADRIGVAPSTSQALRKPISIVAKKLASAPQFVLRSI
ncbi:sigma-70 family RNA polymerase sigma factor [Arenicella xantha]|nr:sigma-70 family RNA polymerase sigma factor [Arenicella xantha]